MTDHVHILVSILSKFNVLQIRGYLKGKSDLILIILI